MSNFHIRNELSSFENDYYSLWTFRDLIKFSSSEKATKMSEIVLMVLKFTFVAFSEKLNFKNELNSGHLQVWLVKMKKK